MEEQGREGKFLEAEDLYYMNLELEKQKRRELELSLESSGALLHAEREARYRAEADLERLRCVSKHGDHTDLRQRIDAKKKAHQERVKKLTEKYGLDGKWGYDPDTGLITT
jgi:hypothetical protein